VFVFIWMEIIKGSEAYKNGIRCEPNLDVLIEGHRRRMEACGVDLEDRAYISEEALKPIDGKFEW